MIKISAERGFKISRLLPYIILLAVTMATYANSLSGGFVWDDNLFAKNQVYWDFDLRTIFFSLANSLEYQPVRDISFLFDIAVWGDRPFGFHLTNLLIFSAFVLLIYRTAFRLHSYCRGAVDRNAAGIFVPLVTALLFALHPLRSEVVAWVTQRNTLLATFFFTLSLLLFLRYLDEQRGKTLLAGSIGAFILAIFSKATVVILPLLLLFLLLFRRDAQQRRLWWLLIPYFAVSAAAATLHIAIAKTTSVIGAAKSASIGERLIVALQIPFFYLKKTLFPTDISAFYVDHFARSPAAPVVIAAAVGLLLAAALAWQFRHRCPEFAIGGGWFIITLIPVSNLFATNPIVADRYTFLPAIGLCFMAASLLGRLVRGRLSRFFAMSVAALLLISMAVMTVGRNRVWRNDIALWTDTATRSPGVAGVWFNLGRAWHRTTGLGMALDAYLRALTKDCCNIEALDNAASMISSTEGPPAYRKELVRELVDQLPASAGLTLIGHTDNPWPHPEVAEALFLKLLTVDRDSAVLQLALANLYRKVGAVERAAVIYGAIQRRGVGRGEAEFGLARIAAAGGNFGEAGRLLALARQKGGVPSALLEKMEKLLRERG